MGFVEEKGEEGEENDDDADNDDVQGDSTARTAMVATWLPPAASVVRRSRG